MKLTRFLLFSLAATLLAAVRPAAADTETVLRYTDHEPYGNMRTRLIKEVFFAAIEKESQGRLRIDDHWNGELSTSYDALRTIGDGTRADIGIVVPEYTAAQLPLHQIFKSFPLGPDSGDKQVAFFSRAFSELPELPAELARNNLVNLQFFVGYPAAFFSTKPLASLDDLHGTTWRTASFWHQSYLQNAGGRTIGMPWNAQITQALRDGSLDGLMVNLDSGDDIGAQRAAPEVLLSPSLWLGHVYLLTMNRQRWETLAPADRQAIQRAAESTQKVMGRTLDRSLAAMARTMEEDGEHVRFLRPDELQAWKTATRYQQVQAEWIAKQQADGVSDSGRLMNDVAARLNDVMR